MKGEHLSWVSETRLAWCMYVWPGHKGVQASDEARGQSQAGETRRPLAVPEAHSQALSSFILILGPLGPQSQ